MLRHLSALFGLLAALAFGGTAQAACTAANANASLAESTPTSAFADHGNGTVTHSLTGLMWKQCAQGQSGAACAAGSASPMNWTAALAAARVDTTAGYTDWRLPNERELESLVETCGYGPAINQTVFPSTVTAYYWSASSYVPDAARAWVVSFYDGNSSADFKSPDNSVRLVRGGQSVDAFDAQPDTLPDVFTFTAQTGVPLASLVTSNTITVSGVAAGTAISIVGGTYKINSGSYTSSAGTVSNGDTVTVQQISMPSASTLTTATLTIGTASAGFDVTTVALSSQTITFTNPGTQTYGTAPTLSATASSGLTVSFSADASSSGVCAITSGGALSFIATGNCTIHADQAGNSTYSSAPTVSHTFAVNPGTQATLTVSASNTTPSYGSTVTLSTAGGSGTGAISFSSNNANCTISGSTLTAAAVGSCTVTATKAADTNYSAATATIGITVSKANQATLTVSATSITPNLGSTVTLSATGGSGTGAVSYSSNNANCTISGSTLTAAVIGSCTVTATKAADTNYNVAIGTLGITVNATTSGAPTAVTGTAGNTQATISWTAPVSNGGSAITGYNVQVATSAGGPYANAAGGCAPATANTSTATSCTATDLANGTTYYFKVAAINSAGTGSYSSASGGVTPFGIDPPPPPEVTIPLLGLSPSCGLVEWPPIVNLGAGEGPAFAADLVAILSNVLGMPLRWVEQSAACGSVVLAGYNGGNLAFIPYGFQTGDARANGVYAVGDGQYHLVRNGQQLTLAPAFAHLEQLAALLPGVAVTQLPSGAIRATVNGVHYVLQPSVAVQLVDAGGGARLTLGDDGRYHFVDAQGNSQVLHPAFAEPATLRRILQGLDLRATVNIALDGTATIDFNGQRYTLVPDLTQEPVPGERAGQDWWQESEKRYRLVNLQSLPVRSLSQGFEVR